MDDKTQCVILGLVIVFMTAALLIIVFTVFSMPVTGKIWVDAAVVQDMLLRLTGLGLATLLLGLIGGYLFGRAQYRSRLLPPPPSATSPLERKYCRHCGSENKFDASFCEKCGKSLG